MGRLNTIEKQKLREMYQSGQFTRPELARIFRVSRVTVDRALSGVRKPFKYDAMNIAISLDRMKEKGREIPDYTYEPLTLLTKPPEYRTLVLCPEGCGYKSTANHLLSHLVRKHQRYDLEYLLEE